MTYIHIAYLIHMYSDILLSGNNYAKLIDYLANIFRTKSKLNFTINSY